MRDRPVVHWGWLLAALVLGLGAGTLDAVAREVQGPLLVLMASAFVVAIPRRVPAWAIAVGATFGLPLAQVVASPWGGDPPSWGMLIALVPTLGAAYAGAFVGTLITRSGGSVTRASLGDRGAGVPWFHRPADSTALLLGALAVCAVVGVVPVFATLSARQQPVAWWVATWWQIASFVGWVLLVPLVLALRKQLVNADGAITASQLMIQVCVVISGAVIHASVIVALTLVLFVPLGAATVGRAIGWAFIAYLPLDALTYTLVLALAHASDRDRRERLAHEHAASLTAQLDRARLAALEAQIRPHFLFNALNAAVVLVKQGPAEHAVMVLTGLAEMLRYVLDDSTPMVPLDDELAFVTRYLTIEQVRLADRLRWQLDASSDARRTLVPRLVLQPLVENALRHGVGKQLRGGDIVIAGSCDSDTLRIMVSDDGPGMNTEGSPSDDADSNGIGLANTRARLSALYGGRAALDVRPRPGGGTIAEVVLPRSIERGARSA